MHVDQIERYGGSHGVRDPGQLEAAVYRPQTGSWTATRGPHSPLPLRSSPSMGYASLPIQKRRTPLSQASTGETNSASMNWFHG
jgi:hypothetical protein